MKSVNYKFRSEKDFCILPIPGDLISVANMKRKILETLNLQSDDDILLYNASTNEEYNDEALLIRAGMSVILRRLPCRSMTKPSTSVDAALSRRRNQGGRASQTLIDLLPRCILCDQIVQDAIITRCCFDTFCDKCIKEQIVSNSACVCGSTNIAADHFIPNNAMRALVNRVLGKGGSRNPG